MHADLDKRRTAVAEKLAALRLGPEVADLVRQADAAVAGIKAEAAELERELDTVDALIGARARHQRDEAERRRLEDLARQRQQLVELAEERRQAVVDAEAGARQLAAALGRMLDVTAKMAKLTHVLTGKSTPAALAERDVISRLGMRVSAVMAAIPGCRNHLGGIVWPSSLYPAADDWSAGENRLVESAIEPILRKEAN